MAGQSFASTVRKNKVALTTGHAGDYAGTNAVDGAAGTASGKTTVKDITLAAHGTTTKNALRIWLHDTAGGGFKSFLREIIIPAITVDAGVTPAYSGKISLMEELGSTTQTLCYDLESNLTIDITETLVDFA